MSSLNLRILDNTDDSVNEVIGRYSDGKALKVLKRYLEPGGDLSMEQALKLIDDMLPNPEERDLHFQLENFGCLTLEQAQQIPYEHPAQMRFARFLQRLQRSYKLNEIGWTDEGYKIYASMHSFRTAVREWYDPEFEPETDEEVYFVNISAFIARLAALNILDGTLWAISTMKDTLENEPSARYYSSRVSAAALWILCAGQWLCDEVLRPREANPSTGGIWDTDGLYTGPTHGLDRWKFWQKAFAAAADSEYASDECKKLALRATNLMECLARDSM